MKNYLKFMKEIANILKNKALFLQIIKIKLSLNQYTLTQRSSEIFNYEGCLQSLWTHLSTSQLCGRVVMVSVLKYHPWQAMHFLQCATHFSKTCCRSSVTL